MAEPRAGPHPGDEHHLAAVASGHHVQADGRAQLGRLLGGVVRERRLQVLQRVPQAGARAWRPHTSGVKGSSM